MKHLLKNLAIVAVLSTSFANAAECVLTVTRWACPGKEAESYAKCDGKQSCNQKLELGSAETCQSEAVKACENKRIEITQYKKITARFKGAELSPGKDYCNQDSGSYVVRDNFPYRNLSDCK